MIHVCFGLHDGNGRYSKFTGTAICSIFDNTKSEVTAHILHDNTLTQDNREKFLTLAARYNQNIKFYNVDELCPREIIFLHEKLSDDLNSRFSIATFYRLFAKKILAARGVHRIIYLDSDIIVNLDINELWQHDLKNFPVAAVPEIDAALKHIRTDKFLLQSGFIKPENYFCAGVMIFDLDKLNENLLLDGVQFLKNCPECECFDQDILNAFFAANYLKLEQKFDSFVEVEKNEKNPVVRKIYHYAGNCIELDSSDGYNNLWLKYFLKTPWFGIEIFGRLDKKFGQMYLKLHTTAKKALIEMSVAMRGKTRAFFVTSAEVDLIKQILSVRDDEEIILADTTEAVPNLVCSMAKAQGKKLFFIIVPKFSAVQELLEQLDFVPERDFINGRLFVMTKEDTELDSFKLIKEM